MVFYGLRAVSAAMPGALAMRRARVRGEWREGASSRPEPRAFFAVVSGSTLVGEFHEFADDLIQLLTGVCLFGVASVSQFARGCQKALTNFGSV